MTKEQRNWPTPSQRLANAMASVGPTPVKRHEAAVMALAGCFLPSLRSPSIATTGASTYMMILLWDPYRIPQFQPNFSHQLRASLNQTEGPDACARVGYAACNQKTCKITTKNDPFAFSSIPALKSPRWFTTPYLSPEDNVGSESIWNLTHKSPFVGELSFGQARTKPVREIGDIYIYSFTFLQLGTGITDFQNLPSAAQTSRHTASDPSRPTASDLDQLAEDNGRRSVEFGHGCTALFRCSIASLGNDTQNLRMNPDPTSKCIVFHVRFRASPIPLAPIHRRVDSIGQGPANCNSLAIGTNTHRRPPIPWHIRLYVRQWYLLSGNYPVPSDNHYPGVEVRNPAMAPNL
ncbi:hypothetical protein B0H16DRAFT_1468662 [Mycena metata]|uniref:Uncharacterized protein n=1 Tax=Mycena metata TaxID=1033252 RepID=A0AAD7MVE4_9AGAR|nr:hypothetical protein B0H16DRAFT_1468662 [Mycena metata]